MRTDLAAQQAMLRELGRGRREALRVLARPRPWRAAADAWNHCRRLPLTEAAVPA